MRDQLQTLSKALDVLLTLAWNGGEMKATQLESELSISRSSMYRIISTLRSKNFIESGPQGSYRLGLSFLTMGLVASSAHFLGSEVETILARIVKETGETAMLTGVTFPNAICIARVESPQPIRLSYETGKLMPLCSGASGKILLSQFDADDREHYLFHAREHGLLTNWNTEEQFLLQQLTDAKKSGYLITSGEVDQGAFAVAVPVVDRLGKCRYGLSIAGPAQRLQADKFVQILKETASELEALLFPASSGGDRIGAAD